MLMKIISSIALLFVSIVVTNFFKLPILNSLILMGCIYSVFDILIFYYFQKTSLKKQLDNEEGFQYEHNLKNFLKKHLKKLLI